MFQSTVLHTSFSSHNGPVLLCILLLLPSFTSHQVFLPRTLTPMLYIVCLPVMCGSLQLVLPIVVAFSAALHSFAPTCHHKSSGFPASLTPMLYIVCLPVMCGSLQLVLPIVVAFVVESSQSRC